MGAKRKSKKPTASDVMNGKIVGKKRTLEELLKEDNDDDGEEEVLTKKRVKVSGEMMIKPKGTNVSGEDKTV